MYFYNAFLKTYDSWGVPRFMSSEEVYELVGGTFLDDNGAPVYKNACTVRISRALNYNNQEVPVFFNDAGVQKTQKGSDGKNYILNVSALLAYMKKAYPYNEPLHLENKTPEEYIDAIKGKVGIYIMIPKPVVRDEFDASGHADLFFNNRCTSYCYFQYAQEIYFWELIGNIENH